MRHLYLLLFMAFASTVLLSIADDQPLARGTKGDVEDVILVGADDWHAAVAATPLAIYSQENRTVVNPMLILPRDITAGERSGWVEKSDLERYGERAILDTFKSANVSAIVVHGSGDKTRSLVEAAEKDGIKAYVTVTLEIPISDDAPEEIEGLEEEMELMAKAGLTAPIPEPDESVADQSMLQRPNPLIGGTSSYYCPVNPEARDNLYNQIEMLIDDYHVHGVVLYQFGFQDENYCYCDVCKERFYQDTGIDISKVNLNSYNRERWTQWKQDKLQEIVMDARNITTDLGPVKLGLALDSPFDRSRGYNFAEMTKQADFTIISPISAEDVTLALGETDLEIYVRLSDDYVGYVLSTQNVQGAIDYIEDLAGSGAGVAFEYDVVHTPVWSELQPPSPAARWLLGEIGEETLGIGNVSWNCSSRILANNSFDLGEKISRRWQSSPGAVIAADNYSAALQAAPIASYLNWPLLFVDEKIPEETRLALVRLGIRDAVLAGPISEIVHANLSQMNITEHYGTEEFFVSEMKKRNESPITVVVTNSHDLSLLPPASSQSVDRSLVKDLLIRTELIPDEIPAEEVGEIVRVNFTMTNTGDKLLRRLVLRDIFPRGRLIRLPSSASGDINVTDPYSGKPSSPTSSFLNGSLLYWELGRLEPGKSASLNVEVELMYPMDSGWSQRLDTGATASFEGFAYNHTMRNVDDLPVINLTYPKWIYSGGTNITWNIERNTSHIALNLYSPDERAGRMKLTNISQNGLYDIRVQLLTPGDWLFNIETDDDRTENYTIDVRSNVGLMNVTAFSHTKVPRLSMVAAEAASARKALLVDVAKDPQQIDPVDVEVVLDQKVADLGLEPEYLMVVGDPGSLPFISTGLIQKLSPVMEYEVYRDYQINPDDSNYSTVAVGRIMGLSVYDASQLMARTLAYDRLDGGWKRNALVISSPPLSFPQAPVGISIREYLEAAGLTVRDLRHEEATSQQAVSQMNNGQNIAHFSHHGNEGGWQLSSWSMTDPGLTVAQVKELTLTPQTTTVEACVTANLKGYYLNVTGTRIYVPGNLEDSISLAFIRAGAVNYVGGSALTWIFLSDDYYKRFYQSMVYENATVGQAQLDADNLFRLKTRGTENLKPVAEYDEIFPPWDISIHEMLNQTSYMNVILGDPSFRPALPQTPSLPYATRISAENDSDTNSTFFRAAVVPLNESATDWVYWIESESSSGELNLDAPHAIIGEVLLPKDAEKIVVKEDGLSIWHDEYTLGEKKKVMWPIVRPRLGEERVFLIEYTVIPGEVQTINITAGWNAISVYLDPKNPSADRYFKNKPYSSIFTVSENKWDFGMKEVDKLNLTNMKAGEGYLIDSTGNFTIEIPGKPVDLPYRLDLHEGWNMIGLPVNRSIDLANITINAEHKRYKYPEAVKNGLLSAFVWKYEGEEWINIEENETLKPGRAYLFEAKSEAKLEFRSDN